jgi:hypothetical protein
VRQLDLLEDERTFDATEVEHKIQKVAHEICGTTN